MEVDFASRFSAVLFGGAGKAIKDWSEFGDADWHGEAGAGGRYWFAGAWVSAWE
jgi:hypothetical protein